MKTELLQVYVAITKKIIELEGKYKNELEKNQLEEYYHWITLLEHILDF